MTLNTHLMMCFYFIGTVSYGSLERDGTMNKGGGWYHQSIKSAIYSDGQIYEVLDVLAKQVGVKGVFSDWPATVTYYANCMGLE